ncbi:DHA2 family efflux MFS transporter permease subunit [Micromonospora sp. WMMD708]|uniref:DHA2 family efflux MFS transporter permease subunit n=1 Tax=Micromonospora sp. WMMD708 TaxID=3403464 RepID=UPI003BF58855
MSTGTTPSSDEALDASADRPDPRRWKALALLGFVQFMFVIDMTVVSVALPRIQDELDMSRTGLAWVVNGYVLMAGGLLLFGGRLADLFGRRRIFVTGVVIFAIASVISGAAMNPEMLIYSRFLQGVGEALAAPAALGIVFLLFSAPADRVKAVGIWGGLSGLAGTLGPVVGGLIVADASWRWIFYVNVPVAVIALALVGRLVGETRMERTGQKFNFAGVLTATAGLVAIVYGLLQAAERSWLSSQVLLPLLGGLVLIGLMLLIESRAAAPLIPLRFFTNRTRAVGYLVGLTLSCAFFGFTFLTTLFEQQVLGYSPLKGGLSFIPVGLGIAFGVGLSTGMIPKFGVKPVIIVGLLGVTAGLLLLSGISVDTHYASGILPGMLVLGLFFGLAMPGTANTALYKVGTQDTGLASAMQNVMQQVGGALGLSVLVALALRLGGDRLAEGVNARVAATEGYVLSYRVSAVLLVVVAVIVLLLLDKIGLQGDWAEPAAQAPAAAPSATADTPSGDPSTAGTSTDDRSSAPHKR